MIRSRSAVVAAAALGIVAAAAAAAGLGAWSTTRDPAGDAPHAAVHPETRRAALLDLRNRLVPSAAGGWVAESPAGESASLEGWLLAASQEDGPSAAYDRALGQADRTLADDPEARSLSLVIAAVAPGPTADPARADRLASEVLDRAEAGLARGDGSWLAPLLQLSAGASPSAGRAGRLLAGRAGPVGCDRLPAPGEAVPPPGASLTVVLRVLAWSGARCDRAPAVLAAAVRDPAWRTWIATAELTDLAELSGDLPAATRRDLAARLDGFVAVGRDRPIDLGAVVAVQAARGRLDLPVRLRPVLEHHLAGQVAHRGALPGRVTSPPNAIDVAVLRQLVGEDLVAPEMLADTVAAAAWPEIAGPVDPVVDQLLVHRTPFACGGPREPAAASGRVTLVGLIADETRSAVRAWCDDRFDAPAIVDRAWAGGRPEQAAIRIAAAELAACRLDPDSLATVPGRRLRPEGPFATDALLVWARAIAADPVDACAALDGG